MGDTLIDSGRGDPTRADMGWERHVATITTDTSGAGSTTVTWDEEWDGNAEAQATAKADARAFVSSIGNSQATVEVSGGPASTDVDVVVDATGDRRN